MALRDQLERLIDEMVTKGIRYDEAQREFEKKFIMQVLIKADGNLGKAAVSSAACKAAYSSCKRESSASMAAKPCGVTRLG